MKLKFNWQRFILGCVGIALISGMWVSLEIEAYGRANPNTIDSIVTIIYFVLVVMLSFDERKEE